MTSSIAPERVTPSRIALRLEDVSVVYSLRRAHRSILGRFVGASSVTTEYAALDGISFEAREGEMVGVIGANGAGKTTLLRTISGVLRPTGGRLLSRGTTIALIDLLCGFHPHLTGRENLYLQGAFFGLSRREVAERFDAIARFADIGDFMDVPLQTYSAGMILRLAFSLLTSVEADIMVIDEALGVGDAAFQRKCVARLAEHRARGATFVVVSHDLMRLREIADRILWLDHGRIRMLGEPAAVVAAYAESLTS